MSTEIVDIQPVGEEEWHIANATWCECAPRLSRDDRGRLMIVHNAFDGREAFAAAEAALPSHYQRRMSA